MPRRFRQYLTAFTLPFLLGLAVPLFGDPAPGDPGPDDDPDDVKFDDKQQAKFNAAVAAERKATEERVRAKLKAETDAAEAAVKTKREQEEAEKRGEFDTVRASIEQERDKAAQERDGYKTDLDILNTHFEAEYATRVKTLPENVWKYHKPAEAASLAVRMAALASAEAQARDLGVNAKPGNGPNPASAGATDGVAAAEAKMRGRISI
jgi:hypothetical protein